MIMSDIKNSIDFFAQEYKNIISIGGLGPTEDDLTTQAISDFFDKKLALNEHSWQKLEKISDVGKVWYL